MELAFVFGTNGSIRNALLQDSLFGTTVYSIETPKKTFFHAHQTIISRDSEVIATLEMHDYSPGSVTVHHDESDRRITPSKELTLTYDYLVGNILSSRAHNVRSGKSSHYMFRGSDGYKYRWRFDGDCYAEVRVLALPTDNQHLPLWTRGNLWGKCRRRIRLQLLPRHSEHKVRGSFNPRRDSGDVRLSRTTAAV